MRSKNNMKKIILILVLIGLVCVLSGCQSTAVDIYGNEKTVTYGFIEIKSAEYGTLAPEWSCICYDPKTKICYIIVEELYKTGLSPYYIVNDDGKAEIAIYGMNYFGGE